MSNAQLEGKPTKRLEVPKGASQLQKYGNYSPRAENFGDVAHNENVDVGIKDLIQFFRKTTPPPTNFMSIPDNFNGSSEEDKWDKFKTKVFRRPSKKARRKRPPVITLPDSAVAARTTDGHRYIAISIPTEYSPLELCHTSQDPILDSIEAAFQRDVNSKFGMWKISPANRLVTVLNPVPEELRESLSSSSPLSTASEQPDQETALSSPSTRKRAHTVPLSPCQEQPYTPGKAKESARHRSVSDPNTGPSMKPQSSEEGHDSLLATTTKSESRPNKKNVPITTTSKDIQTAERSTTRLPEKPVITLTLPVRKSSRRGKKPEPAPPETIENVAGTRQGSASSTNSNSNGNGNDKRASVAASIDTTGSSPRLFKATTAVVGQSIPVVVRPASADLDSPLDLNFPEPPTNDRSARTSAVGGPPPGLERTQSRKERVREKKQRDTEKHRARTEHKRKGKEPASHPFGFLPGIPAALPGMLPSAILGYRHHEKEDSSSSSSTSPSLSSNDREERSARYIAKALASERETLEKLPREELISRYEALREQRIYERERRLRRLERSRDSWIRAVPVLLQDLNGLLRQQYRILEGAGLTTHGVPAPAGSSHRHTRRRSRSLEVSSSGSPLSDLDPLEPRRSRSLHGSGGGSRRDHRSSKGTP